MNILGRAELPSQVSAFWWAPEGARVPRGSADLTLGSAPGQQPGRQV